MTPAEWAFLAALVGVCILCFLTQEVNPFPHDGWFQSQYRLFEREPAGENFTPIAAPAVIHGGLHAVAGLAGIGLESEMILGSLVHQLMLALSGVAIFMAHRRLGIVAGGAVASLATVLFIESVYMPQAFWSENVMLLIASLLLWWSIEIGSGAAAGRRLDAVTLGLGLMLGIGTITRATPIVLLPAVVWLGWTGLPKGRRTRFGASVIVITLTIVATQMTLNSWRYARFELSHSVGLRLWDSISVVSDQVLEHSPLYQEMKRIKPDIQGAWWWELPLSPGIAQTYGQLEDAVRPMVIDGIRRHPLLFLREGARSFREAFPIAPQQIGKIRSTYYNPLNREDLLPAPGWAAPRLTSALDRYWRAVARLYPWILAIGFGGGLIGFAVRRLRRGLTGDGNPFHFRVWIWLSYTVPGIVYLSNQIEKPDPRFTLPWVGYVAMLASLGIQQAVSATRRRERQPLE